MFNLVMIVLSLKQALTIKQKDLYTTYHYNDNYGD